MTPAGLLASGSVRWTPAKDEPGMHRTTSTDVSSDQNTRMDATLEEPLEDVGAESTNQRDSHRHLVPHGAGEPFPVVPVVFVVGLLVLATSFDGAFALRTWAPPAIFVLALLAVTTFAGGGARIAGRPLAVALGAAWALAGWPLLSMPWPLSPADAWEGASRLVL